MATQTRYRVALFIVTALWLGAADGQPRVDDALVTAARTVMPDDLTDSQLREALEAALWHADPPAVAVSIPRGDEYKTFVFRRQPDDTYSAEDASWVAHTAFGFWGFPREEIESFETKPLAWRVNEGRHLLVQIRTRGWRNGQRYTASGYYLVSPDGRVSGQ